MHKELSCIAICLLLTSCSSPKSDNIIMNSVDLIDYSSEHLNETSIMTETFSSEKKFEITDLGIVNCKLLVYENQITENSDENRSFNAIDISIKYPELMYVVEENGGFHSDLVEYTATLNHLIKNKAMDIYMGERGIYLTGINSVTDYDIKFLDNNLLSIVFKTTSVESTRYTNCFALNIDLSNNNLYEPHKLSDEMEQVGLDNMLTPLYFINKGDIEQEIESNNYKIYSGDGMEITDTVEKERIIIAFKGNLDSYLNNTEKFYITEKDIGFISDEVSHKGDSNIILFQK